LPDTGVKPRQRSRESARVPVSIQNLWFIPFMTQPPCTDFEDVVPQFAFIVPPCLQWE
jgi:hypothetical protein